MRSRPELVQSIHVSFLESGADAVETNTFGANRLVLAEFGLEGDTRKLNQEAAEIAARGVRCCRWVAVCLGIHRPRHMLADLGANGLVSDA